MPRPGRHVPDAYARAPPQDELSSGRWRSPQRHDPGRCRLGHLAAPETGKRRATPANTHRAGMDGRLLSSGSVWWRGDVDEDRRWAWLSANALSAKSGPCGGRSRATTGAISASGVITKPGLRTSTPSAQHGVRPGTRAIPPRPTCGAERMGTWRSPRDVGGAGRVEVRRRPCWGCGEDGVWAMPGSPSGVHGGGALARLSATVTCRTRPCPTERSWRARSAAQTRRSRVPRAQGSALAGGGVTPLWMRAGGGEERQEHHDAQHHE
jgi:hypothetical protein